MDTLILESGTYSLHLAGVGAAPPLRAVRRLPAERLPHGRVREVLEIALEGDAPLNGVPRLAELICARARQGRHSYLKAAASPGAAVYRSLLLDGWVETLGRGPDSAGLRLTLVRAADWEGDLTAVELAGPLETSSAGVTVFRRCDLPGTGMAALALLAAGESSQPAAVRLEIGNTAPGAPAIGDVYVFASLDQDELGGVYRVEAEWGSSSAGVSAQTVSSAACSAGAYVRYGWSSNAPVRLAYWTVTQMLQNLCAGRPVRPLVRLAAPHSGGDCWLHWRVTGENGGPLATGEPVLLEAGRQLHALPAVHFPAGLAGSYLGERVELWAEAAAPAVLELDAWLPLPADGHRRYTALDDLPAGWTLVDDGVDSDLVYARHDSTGQRRETHRAEGPPLEVWPGGRQVFLVAWETPDQAAIDGQVRLRLLTRPRVREI